jgi:polyhydroxyalkanoate synthesis regulator phasin
MNRWMQVSIALVVAVALLAGGAFALTASAQTPPPPATGQVFWSTLAAKLNVSQTALKSAIREAAKAVVAQRVTDGKLKQEAAAKLNDRIDKMSLDKVPLPLMPQNKARAKTLAESMQRMLDAAANVLGMSPRDLMQELRDGLTLGQIAQQKGVAPDKLKAAMLAVPFARIDESVKAGTLTQDAANEMKAKIEKSLDLNKRMRVPVKPSVNKP